jgi:hypothetical protein
MGIKDMQHCIDQRALGWAGHVARMNKTRLPRQLLTACLNNPRKSGGQSLTHGRILRNTLKRKGIDVNTWMVAAQDRGEWRRKCKDVVLDLDRKRINSVNADSLIGQDVEKLFRGKWFAEKLILLMWMRLRGNKFGTCSATTATPKISITRNCKSVMNACRSQPEVS